MKTRLELFVGSWEFQSVSWSGMLPHLAYVHPPLGCVSVTVACGPTVDKILGTSSPALLQFRKRTCRENVV